MEIEHKKSDKELPGYLYHYTSINSLGFILKNRTIKFNNLCDMDDAEEGYDFEIGYGKYCFISSWTDMEKETIEMWKMYSDDMRGVRIRLKKNPFVEIDNLSSGTLTKEKVLEKGYITVKPNDWLYRITYKPMEEISRNSKEDFFEFNENKKSVSIKLGQLGNIKSDYWEFQKEWRYKLIFMPIDEEKFRVDKPEEGIVPWIKMLPELPMKQYYVRVKDEEFEDMEILLGPKTNEIDEEIVKLLVEKYNPNAIIKKSKLINKIR